MTEPRIAPLPAADGERLAAELGLPARTGGLLAFRVLANHPALARGLFTLHGALRHDGRLSDRHRELLILRVAWRAGSAYEWAQHWEIATAAGLPSAQLLRIRQWREADGFTPADRAVLQAVDEVFDCGTIGPDTWDACSDALGGSDLALEVAAAIVHWRSLAILFRSLAIPLEAGTSPWPPDGQAPAEAALRRGAP
ncbi:MAG TPA: carboxymuconolactone decarboxylase family protein [Ramlibacter sp.]|nr:carboxymuconolactone decarboxylase family protein [Ramlibacter sp.]